MKPYTTYEISAKSPAGENLLIGFSPRLSRIGLFCALEKRGDAIIKRLHVGDNDQITFTCKPRVHATLCGWTLGFTGRTERDCIRAPLQDLECGSR